MKLCDCGREIVNPKMTMCMTCNRKRWPKKTYTNEERRAWWLKTQYGITAEQYDLMLWSQGGVCAICREPSDKALCVDHSHSTGEVRGLLCVPCNQAIGLLRADMDSERLLAAYRYIAMCEWIEESVNG